MDKFNEIQRKWINYANLLASSSGNNSSLRDLIAKDNDGFVALALDSKKSQLSLYSFNIQSFDDSKKELYDKLFHFATELDSLTPDNGITQRLIDDLKDSLLGSFSL